MSTRHESSFKGVFISTRECGVVMRSIASVCVSLFGL